MLRPNAKKEYNIPDLKLGIKSSLPNVKSTLGLLFMFWKSSYEKSEIAFSQMSSDKIILSEEYRTKLIETYSDVYMTYGITDFNFTEKINENQIFKSQLESLIVAFELIWRVGKIRFSDEKSVSSERTGRKRFPKIITFSKNMDIIDTLLSSDENAFSKILLAWIGFDIEIKQEKEKALLKLLVNLSEESVYKLVDEEENVIFNMNSIY
ncbi:hypothetical protein, partial [Staphylococcus equorum]